MFTGTDEVDVDTMNIGTDVDTVLDQANRMESESPSSELEHLAADHSSDNDSVREGRYEVNPGSALGGDMESSVDSGTTVDIDKDNISDNVESVKSDSMHDSISLDSMEPEEKKSKKDRRVTDSYLLEKRGLDGSGKLNETFSGSRPSSAASSGKSGSPSKEMKGKKCTNKAFLVKKCRSLK